MANTTNQEALHITTPHQYFANTVGEQPIFGIKNFKGHKFLPIKSSYNNRAVFYMTDSVKNNKQGAQMKNTMPQDSWEYFRYAQLDMANKFEDTLAYREKMGIPCSKEVLFGLQYLMLGMLRYSNFNFIIDFNELNRISLAPEKQAREELFVLIAAATQNINWAIIQNSNLKDTHPTLGRDLFFEALALNNPPKITISDIDTYLYRYDFMRDEVLKSEACTPWEATPIQGLTAQKIIDDFSAIKNKCGKTTQASQMNKL